MSEVIVESVEKELKLTLTVSSAPELRAEHFLPLLTDSIEVIVTGGKLSRVTLKGVVPKKDGSRSNRPNKIWYYSDFLRQAPEWLTRLVEDQIRERRAG